MFQLPLALVTYATPIPPGCLCSTIITSCPIKTTQSFYKMAVWLFRSSGSTLNIFTLHNKTQLQLFPTCFVFNFVAWWDEAGNFCNRICWRTNKTLIMLKCSAVLLQFSFLWRAIQSEKSPKEFKYLIHTQTKQNNNNKTFTLETEGEMFLTYNNLDQFQVTMFVQKLGPHLHWDQIHIKSTHYAIGEGGNPYSVNILKVHLKE